jgi:hypothetical protein
VNSSAFVPTLTGRSRPPGWLALSPAARLRVPRSR